MKKVKSIALLIFASAFLIGSLTGCCCPKAPEITSADAPLEAEVS